ncbi:unnamed protein product [Litomosoides sigmodontis]|uniref:Uncharacterized protein n=1 Tax=Litomosoides sigmodontis TaxID=42156 RepID=A0A3P6URZ3_LITSI|nr:unnamed protein product [Litomosoides sigmodontis]
MASDDSGHSDQKRESKQQPDEEASDSTSEAVQKFMSKVCARLEKLHVMSRLMEEPKEQTESNKTSWRKSKKFQKVTGNVYEFFCNKPSVGKDSVQKLQSKTEQSGSEASGSTTGQSAESVGAEEIDIVKLSKQSGSSWNDKCAFAKQPYIENPEEPSTSTGLRNKVKIDREMLAKISRLIPNVNQEGSTENYLSNLCGIHKEYRVSTASDSTTNADSVLRKSAHSMQTIKQAKDGKRSCVGSKTTSHSASFKSNQNSQAKSIVFLPAKNRAQRARERLRRKFEEGQSASPANTRSRRSNI